MLIKFLVTKQSLLSPSRDLPDNLLYLPGEVTYLVCPKPLPCLKYKMKSGMISADLLTKTVFFTLLWGKLWIKAKPTAP
jgi:hypothetical protein